MHCDKVLVTGANGYLSSHIIHILIQQGCRVVGTVRTQPKGEDLLCQYPEGSLQYEIVKESRLESSYQQLFAKHKDIKYVIHTASSVFFNGSNAEKDIVQPAVRSVTSLLNAAKTSSSVTKIVMTSSFACLLQSPARLDDPRMVYDETLWNPVTLEEAGKSVQNSFFASKVFAEKAAWRFIQTQNPQFSLTTIQVPLILGPPINEMLYESITSSSELLLKLITKPKDAFAEWESEWEMSGKMQNLHSGKEPFPFYIDVRDAATIHVKSLLEPSLNNKRCLSVAGVADSFCIVESLCRVCPEYLIYLSPSTRKHLLNLAKQESENQFLSSPGSSSLAQQNAASQYAKCNTNECRKHLQMIFRPLEQSILDTVNRVRFLQKAAISARNIS